MKKKILIGVVITLLIAVIAVEGVIIFKQMNDKKENGQEQIANEVKETEEPAIVSTKKPIKVPETTIEEGENLKIKKEYFAPDEDELVYTYVKVTIDEKDINNRYTYTYEIPQINIESNYIDDLNEQILQKYEAIIDEINDEQVIDFYCEGVKYQCFESNNILSLIMNISTESGGFSEGEVYNIDIETGEKVSNNKLLSVCGITETKLRDNLNLTISDCYKGNENDPNVEADFLNDQREKTLEKYKNMSINDMKLFINDNKQICAYLVIYNIAGPDEGSCWVNVSLKKSSYTNIF